jgi:Fe-S cluster biosynthesis and repair protein YggX
MSKLVTAHATPVGSGTVARTERIPLEQRAESAVIAWMRHQTTAYDSMKIAKTNIRMLIESAGVEVLFPSNTTGVAGYIDYKPASAD